MIDPGLVPSDTASQPRRSWVRWLFGGFGVLAFMACCLVMGGVLAMVVNDSETGDVSQTLAISGETAAATGNLAMATEMARAVHSTSTAQSADATALAQSVGRSGTQVALEATQTVVMETATAESIIATVLAEVAKLEDASTWPEFFVDEYANLTYDWSRGDYTDDRVEGNRTIADGKYRWEVNALDGVNWRSNMPGSPDFSDFYLVVDGEKVSGSEGGLWGVIFRRHDDARYYYFMINDSGQYKLSLLNDDDWMTLIDWTDSAAIQIDASNRIAVIGEGSHFTFFINDVFVDEVNDSTLPTGKLGVAIEMDGAGDQAVYEFDRFVVRVSPFDLVKVTATADAQQGLLQAGRQISLVLEDDFATATQDWALGDFSGDLIENGERLITGGRYRWTASAKEGVIWQADVPGDQDLSVFYLAISAEQQNGPIDSAWGFAFRQVDDDNYYVFQISQAGQYRFRMRQNDEWTTLIGWTWTPVFQIGGMNRLAVMAQSDQFTFFLNDQFIAEAVDSTFSSGTIALSISLFNPGDEVVYEFEDFELRAP